MSLAGIYLLFTVTELCHSRQLSIIKCGTKHLLKSHVVPVLLLVNLYHHFPIMFLAIEIILLQRVITGKLLNVLTHVTDMIQLHHIILFRIKCFSNYQQTRFVNLEQQLTI